MVGMVLLVPPVLVLVVVTSGIDSANHDGHSQQGQGPGGRGVTFSCEKTLITLKSAGQVTIYDKVVAKMRILLNRSLFKYIVPDCDANPAAQVIR